MNTTVDELKTLYVKLGGNLADVKNPQTDAELIDKIEDIVNGIPDVLVFPEDSSTTLFNKVGSDYQTNVKVVGNVIVGNLKYLSSGDVVDAWGAGNFIALKFVIINPNITYKDIKVGLNPSEASELVALDADLNGVFKVTNKNAQNFKVVVTKNGVEYAKEFALSGLTVATE